VCPFSRSTPRRVRFVGEPSEVYYKGVEIAIQWFRGREVLPRQGVRVVLTPAARIRDPLDQARNMRTGIRLNRERQASVSVSSPKSAVTRSTPPSAWT
jgi:hypothetical protein